jgi:hypothetical protein
MDVEMRRQLARESFEEKIRHVGQLIQLAAKLKAQRSAKRAEDAADVAWLKVARQKPMRITAPSPRSSPSWKSERRSGHSSHRQSGSNSLVTSSTIMVRTHFVL